jgi:hypothetical protein
MVRIHKETQVDCLPSCDRSVWRDRLLDVPMHGLLIDLDESTHINVRVNRFKHHPCIVLQGQVCKQVIQSIQVTFTRHTQKGGEHRHFSDDVNPAQFHKPAQNYNLGLKLVCHLGAQHRALINISPVDRLKVERCLLLKLPVPILLQVLLYIMDGRLYIFYGAQASSHHTIWHHSLLELSSQVEGWFHNGA